MAQLAAIIIFLLIQGGEIVPTLTWTLRQSFCSSISQNRLSNEIWTGVEKRLDKILGQPGIEMVGPLALTRCNVLLATHHWHQSSASKMPLGAGV